MNTTDALNYLTDEYGGLDCFDGVGIDRFGRYVVYVKYLNEHIMSTIAPFLAGKQVLLQYSSSKPEVVRQKYATPVTFGQLRDRMYTESVIEEKSMSYDQMLTELDKLERICGARVLGEVFFEVHDGFNAVTNHGADFPDVLERMEKLYDEFGFDVLYEELEL